MALYITGLGTSSSVMGYFADQNGSPRFWAGEDLWGLIASAGQNALTGVYAAGNWQAALDTYFSQRAAQGYNVVETSLFSSAFNNNGFTFTTGQDWDGTWPFTSTNDPSSGLNSTFWARRDYMFSSAASNGFTVVVSVSGPNIEGTSANMPRGWTTAQWQAMGTALGTRYASTPNVFWILGDDYFDTYNTQFNAFITSLRAAGGNQPISIQYHQETTSRSDIVSGALETEQFAQFNWVYTYNPTYPGIDRAFAETAANGFSGGPVPSLWGDGNYLATGGLTGFVSPQDFSLERRMIWWALSEGARGFNTGDNDIYPWAAGSAADVTSKTFYTQQVPAIVSAFSGLTGWHLLEPDTSSVLVTAGRGTKYTGAAPYVTNGGDTWVTASRVPNGSLAVIYMSTPTTITIDQTKMQAGYKATWIDPASGAAAPATAASTYNSTAKGTNSAGDTDWALFLQGPPAPLAPPVPPAITRGPPAARIAETYRASR